MKIADFQWYKPPFPEYNAAQALVIPFVDQDCNLVVSFATASGKTVIAECCFGYHLANSMGRVAYVCPFKSLAAEKYAGWKDDDQFSRYGLVLGTGDTDAGIEEHMAARMAIATTESFDAKTRSERWQTWLKSMVCVCVDEAHLMGDKNRGGAVEAALMRFTSINSKARIVLLSATMGNVKEMAIWIKSLNGKSTKFFSSGWRPTKVHINLVQAEGYEEKIVEAIKIVDSDRNKKVIVFVHSKVTGADLLKRMRKMGIRTAFHNASLASGKRRKIEEYFSKSDSGLNVIISTSTLGSGVNLA